MASEEQSPLRALAIAVAAMAAVAVLLGAVVGGGVMAAMSVTGVGEESATAQEAPQTLTMPDYSPTQTPGGADSATAQPTRKPPAARLPIRLFMAPQRVPAGGRINVNGIYERGPEGATLTIQRLEGRVWTDFPVDARVSGGAFDTWIQTSRTGPSRFRVVDEASGRRSNVVLVTIG